MINCKTMEEFKAAEKEVEDQEHLIFFYAEWASPAMTMKKVLEEYDLGIKIIAIDIVELPQIARAYDLKAVPLTVKIGEDGEIIRRQYGFDSEETLPTIIEATL